MTDKVTPLRETTFTDVHVAQLLFDPSNPRFGGKSKRYSLADIEQQQERIQKVLEGDPHHALRLVESFAKNGFIRYEPLVVRQVGTKFVVIEGNRRLAAVRYILQNQDGSFGLDLLKKLQKIPVLIFHQADDQSHVKDMRVYLGVRHLFGFKDWPAESKAVFLDEQIKSAEDLQRTVDELGIKKPAIRRYLVPFRMMRKAGPHLRGISDQEFWVLGEALTRSAIPEYVELDVDPDTLEVQSYNPRKLEKLIDFLYGEFKNGIRDKSTRKITETRDSSDLARVLGDSTAAAKLERGSTLEESLLQVQTPSQNMKRLRSLLRELAVIVRSVASQRDANARELKQKYQEFSRSVRRFLKSNA